MSNAPDFSSAIDIVEEDALAEAEKRLHAKRKIEQRKNSPSNANGRKRGHHIGGTDDEPNPKKTLASKMQSRLVVTKSEVSRKPITLKVLAENANRFHQLFHQLQIQGDVRGKQDLADEAMELLFHKYKSVLI